MEPLSFQRYICSLDPTTLPRVLRICSGVYFQGSVYEISGNECCLSTGDLLKVTAVELQKVVCEDTETGQTMELPPTFEGHFQPAPALGPHQTPHKPFPKTAKQQVLTLQQVLGLWDRQPQPLLCPTISPHPLLLHPVYEVQAAMQLRRDLVKVPSTLEVDVEDVTEEAQHVRFARPLLLSEVLAMEEAMPTLAEVLEGPAGPAVFQSAWERRLRRGQWLQLHGRSRAWRVLASAPGSGRHFLLSSAYQGRFRRRPRRFAAVRELAAALEPGRRLRLVVTQDCEGLVGDVAPLAVGDRLEVQGLQGSGAGTRLLCHRRGVEEDEEEGEELLLPLDVSGGFLEEASDSKKYSLEELLQLQPLPCEVRLAAPDPALGRDALAALPALRLEALLDQPFLVGSFCEEPEEGFEIPPRWLDLSVLLSEGPVRPLTPCTLRCRLEELTEAFYYRLLAQLPGSAAQPPPRPPKPARSGTAPEGRRPAAPRSAVPRSAVPRSAVPRSAAPVGFLQAPPLPPLPGPPGPSAPGAAGTDSDSAEHDYETVDDSTQRTVHEMQAIVPF